MTYTIEFSLDQRYVMEHVAATEVPAILASIEDNHGRVDDIIAERERI